MFEDWFLERMVTAITEFDLWIEHRRQERDALWQSIKEKL